MARIRTIKPEFWRSPDIMELTYFQRLLYIGLWNLADDEGRGEYQPAAIAADLFLTEYSLNPHGVLTDVSCAFTEYSNRQMITLYRVENRDYYEIRNWKSHQSINRASKSKRPAPTSENTIHTQLTEDSLSTHGGLTLGTGNREQGTGNMNKHAQNEFERVNKPEPKPETEPEPAPEPPSEAFEKWWETYPRKVGKRKAETAWKSALNRVDEKTLNEATQNFADHHKRAGTEARFIPHATTWLNRDGWNDELPQAPNGTTVPGRMSNAEVARQLQAKNAQDAFTQQRELSNAEALEAWMQEQKAIGF